jgi:hypothetical protein
MSELRTRFGLRLDAGQCRCCAVCCLLQDFSFQVSVSILIQS